MRWTVLMSLIASIAANHVIKGMLNLQPNTDIIYIYSCNGWGAQWTAAQWSVSHS